MTEDIWNKLADILDTVIEPESNLSISELAIVAGIKHDEDNKQFLVYMNPLDKAKACCMVFQLVGYSEVEVLLKEAIEHFFPTQTVVFKNPWFFLYKSSIIKNGTLIKCLLSSLFPNFTYFNNSSCCHFHILYSNVLGNGMKIMPARKKVGSWQAHIT